MKKTPRWSLIPYAVLCCCASGLAAQGTWAVGKSIAVAPRPPDARSQDLPAAASDGAETFLVVWQQGQDFHQQQSADIFAARVSPGGRLLDAAPLVLCAAPDSQLRPRVAFSNGVFLVVWQDLRNGKDFDVYGARVSPGGKVLDKDGFLIAGGPRNQALPDIARAPGGFLVLWQDFRSNQGYELYAASVAASGKAGRAQALRRKGHGLQGGNVSVTFSGEGWFVFWISLDGRPKAARLRMVGGALQVAEVSGRLPNYSGWLGQPASNGRKVLYAGSAVHGRGGNMRPGTGLLFDPGSCRPLPNPNPPVGAGASGWNEKAMICLQASMPPVGVDPPVACAAAPDGFLIAAKGSMRAKPPHSRRILAAWLPNSGQRATDPRRWIVVHDGPAPARSPAAAAGKRDGKSLFLVAYSVGGKDGARIQARLLRRP